MPSELEVVERLDQINKVVEEMIRGKSPLQISRILDIPRKTVVAYIEEWKEMARSSAGMQDRAKDAIAGADQHYSMILNKLYSVEEEATQSGDLKIRVAALNSIASVEEKRIKMLQAAGLLDNQDLADAVAESERKQQALIEILRDVSQKFPEAGREILGRLAKISGAPEKIVTGTTVYGAEMISG